MPSSDYDIWKYIYSYENINLNTEILIQKWNQTSLIWENEFKFINYFSLHNFVNITLLNENEIKIFPNPTSNMLYVSNMSGANLISIFDLNGKLVIKEKLSEEQINVSSLQKGIYIIKIENKNNIFSHKFVKE